MGATAGKMRAACASTPRKTREPHPVDALNTGDIVLVQPNIAVCDTRVNAAVLATTASVSVRYFSSQKLHVSVWNEVGIVMRRKGVPFILLADEHGLSAHMARSWVRTQQRAGMQLHVRRISPVGSARIALGSARDVLRFAAEGLTWSQMTAAVLEANAGIRSAASEASNGSDDEDMDIFHTSARAGKAEKSIAWATATDALAPAEAAVLLNEPNLRICKHILSYVIAGVDQLARAGM